MPKKVNKALFNQNKTIKTRLMQISMVLDDYIYKSKPISSSQAEMYIAEVASYKTPCQKDLRSLQVIEKLTSCMKKIIAERQSSCLVENVDVQNNMNTSGSANCYSIQSYVQDDLNNTQLTCPSPTYSIISGTVVLNEEDQDINRGSMEEDIGEIEIVQLVENITSVALERSMTSLTIVETSATQQAIENDSVHSQSILTDFVGCDEIIDLEKCYGQDMEEYFKGVYEETKRSVSKVTNSVEKGITKKVDVKQNNTEEISIKRRKERKIATKRNKSAKAKTTENNNQMLNSHQDLLTDSNISNNSNNISKDLPNASKALKRSGTPKNAANKRKAKISVEDLSWIENIKYVRVVDSDEFDPNLNNLSESFWDKFCLPPVWDDRDFEY